MPVLSNGSFNMKPPLKFVLDNGAAIPHAIADIDQNRLFLHLSVLTHAITIGGKSVSYIFVIGIPWTLGKKALEDLSMLYDLVVFAGGEWNGDG